MTFRFALCLLLLPCLTAPASADQLRDKMMRLAERVLGATDQQPVKVGVFSPTGLTGTNVGPGFEGLLAQCLNRLRPGVVQDAAKFEIKGDYAFAKSREQPNLSRVIKVNARVIDLEYGEELDRARFRASIDHTKSIAAVLQESVALPPDGTKEERNRALVEALEDPSAHLSDDPSLVRSTPDSPFALQVLVKPAQSPSPAEPRAAHLEGGRPFVDIGIGELYELRAYNQTDQEVVVRVYIDGLDIYHFSQDRNDYGEPRYTHTTIPPRGSARILGWHNSVQGPDNYLSFLVTGYGRGAVSEARIPSRGNVGIIHAQFSFSRPIPPGVRVATGKETGFGPPRTVKQNPVRREIDPPHDFVSIRYAREEQGLPPEGPQ